MTRSEARRILETDKLVFGDPRQVEAVRCIEAVSQAEAAYEGVEKCEACGGKGTLECHECTGEGVCSHGNQCSYCNDGNVTCKHCKGHGSREIDWDRLTPEVALAKVGLCVEG